MDNFLQLQIAVNLFFQHLSDLVPDIARLFSLLGDGTVYFPVISFLYWCIDSSLGMRIGAALLLSNGIVSGMKMLFHSPRPYWFDSRVIAYAREPSFGFPSGHSANSASVWGVFAACIRKNWVWVISIIIVLMIGLSRLALGVHFLMDVVGGWLTGLIIVVLLLRFEKPVTQWFGGLSYSRQWITALASAVLILLPSLIICLLLDGLKLPEAWSVHAGAALNPFSLNSAFMVAGTWFGLLCGWVWFRHHFGKLTMDGNLSTRLVRFLAGMFGLIVLWNVLGFTLPSSDHAVGQLLRYLRYGLIGFWITGAAPWLFRKMENTLNEQKNTLQ